MSAPVLPEYVTKHAPWSISKLGTIEKCAQLFDFRYVHKPPGEAPQSSLAMRMGNAVHAVLEEVLKGTALQMAMEVGINKGDLTSNEIEELRSFEDNIVAFVARFKKFCDGFSMTKDGVVYPVKKLIEENVAFDFELKPTSFWNKATGFFRGKVDIALITADGTAIVMDHKSGREAPINDHEDQLKVYCVSVLAKFPEIKEFITYIHYVKSGNIVQWKRISAKTVREEYNPWIYTYAIESAKKLLDEEKTIPDVDPTTGKSLKWVCDNCEYKKICPKFLKR
jgi:CRISPR/Cas system-associated exonuclease Cas4 (RecB family)